MNDVPNLRDSFQPTSLLFSPTRLSTTLTSSSPPLPTSVGSKTASATRSQTHGQGFIVLETNYKVYAYTGEYPRSSVHKPTDLSHCHYLTENPLQTAVLNLFVSLKYRFPNLVVGTITRDSVRRALTNGISADQVSQNTHVMRRNANSRQTRSLAIWSHMLIHRCVKTCASKYFYIMSLH